MKRYDWVEDVVAVFVVLPLFSFILIGLASLSYK